VRGPDHAGAQTFVTGDDALHTVAAWVVSQSTGGQVTASVRTRVTDPATEIASATVDLGARGGTGQGWLEFDLDGVPLTPGEEYSLVLQAHDTDGPVAWWGVRAPVADAAASWDYDRARWDGWMAYGSGPAERFAGWRLAFYVNDGRERCASDNTCWRHLDAADLGVQPAGLVGSPGHPHAL